MRVHFQTSPNGCRKKPEHSDQKGNAKNNMCISCKSQAHVLLAQTSFCASCFSAKMHRAYAAALRKALSLLPRSRAKRVLVPVFDSASNEVLRCIISNSTSAMLEYDCIPINECVAESYKNRKRECDPAPHGRDQKRAEEKTVQSLSSGVLEKKKKAVAFAEEQKYDCVVFSTSALEAAESILCLLSEGKIEEYETVFYNRNVCICHPFHALSPKHIFYYHLLHCPDSALQTPRSRAELVHSALLRELLKTSPVSVFNLVRTQEKIMGLKQESRKTGG